MNTAVTDAGQPTNNAGEQQTTDLTQGQVTPPQGEGTADTKPAEGTTEVSYEFKMPEGIEMDQAAAEAFIPIAKELGLSQEQAQKIVDIQAQAVQRQTEAWLQTQAQWADEVRGDKEIGGDRLNESLAQAKRAIDFIGDPALTKLLNETGYGNHPVLVKAFVKIGKQLAPDNFVGGRREPSGEKDAAKVLFPNMN